MISKSYSRWTLWTVRGIAAASLVVGYMADAAADAPRSTPVSTTAPTPPASTSDTAPKVICLQNSIRCFSVKSAATGTATRPALDLRPPDIHRVFSAAELSQTLQDPDEAIAVQETVQVEGQRQQTPVSVGIMALPWAVMHPTQAWRIFMPMSDAK